MTSEMRCLKCGTTIPAVRLQALPGTDVCVLCSTVQRFQGVSEGLSKSHSILHVLDPNTVDGRQGIADMRRYTPYRHGNSVICTAVQKYPFGKGSDELPLPRGN